MPRSWDPDLLNRFRAQIELPSQALAGLCPEQLDQHPVEGKWSVRQWIVHVVDSDLVGGWRMKRVIAETSPSYWAFDQDAFMQRLAVGKRDLPRLCELFRLHRLDLLDILGELSEEDFARTGIHSDNGVQSLGELVEIYVRHVERHVVELNRKRVLLGVAPVEEKSS